MYYVKHGKTDQYRIVMDYLEGIIMCEYLKENGPTKSIEQV